MRISNSTILPFVVIVSASVAIKHQRSTPVIAFANGFFVAELNELPRCRVGDGASQLYARLHGLRLVVLDAFIHTMLQTSNIDGIYPRHLSHDRRLAGACTVTRTHITSGFQIESLIVKLRYAVTEVIT